MNFFRIGTRYKEIRCLQYLYWISLLRITEELKRQLVQYCSFGAMLFLSCLHQSLFCCFCCFICVVVCLFVLLVCFVFSVVQTTREAMFSCRVGLGRTRSGRTAFSHKILFGSLPGSNFAQYVTSQPARDRRVWGKL